MAEEKFAPGILLGSILDLYYPGPGLSIVTFAKSVLFTPLKKHEEAWDFKFY